MRWTKKSVEQIPTKTTVAAMDLFYSYKMKQLNFIPPVANIELESENEWFRYP